MTTEEVARVRASITASQSQITALCNEVDNLRHKLAEIAILAEGHNDKVILLCSLQEIKRLATQALRG